MAKRLKSFTISAVGGRLGITTQAVSKALKKLGKSKRDFRDLDEAVEYYRRNVGPRSEKPLGALGDETTRLKAMQADIAALELAERRGAVMDCELVRSNSQAACVIFRSQLDGLSSRLAAELAAMTDQAQIRWRLREETDRILAAVAAEFGRLAVAADAGDSAAAAKANTGPVGGRKKGSPAR